MLDLSDLFDDNYYLTQNPLVAAAVQAGIFNNGFQHYQQFGAGENRPPSALFNPSFYLASNPDVAVAALEGKTTAIEHFIDLGQYENRDPITGFDTEYYLENNPDVAQAVATGGITAYQHYLEFGQQESRQTAPEAGEPMPAIPSHPLDPLTEAEIRASVSVIRDQQTLSESALFANISLQEPPKSEVLAFQPGSPFKREAFVVVSEPKENKTYEAIVDLNQQTLTSWKEIPGAQVALLDPEFETVSNVVKADPRWQQAMIARGITNFDDVVVDGWAPGNLTPAERESGIRLIRGLTYYKGSDTQFYRPIEGVLATVDLNTESVQSFIDAGIIPYSTQEFDLDEASAAATSGGLREAPTPLRIIQPEGVSFEINGSEINWQNWHFHYSMNPREGLVLNQVGYEDKGEIRPILYKASLSEMVVPYAEPDSQWIFRNAFDVGEYGLGRLATSMQAGLQVPENSVLLDSVFADDFGEPYILPNSVAIYERDGGLLWQHYDYITDETQARRSRELVMSFITTVGNYDYGVNWIFHQDGTLETEVNLTGILLPKGTAATNADTLTESDKYGTLIAPNIVAVNHQHFFNFRLDFDVDGTANSAFQTNVVAAPPGPNNPGNNAFFEEETPLLTELAATGEPDWKQHREWEIVNSEKSNSLGTEIAYALKPGENAIPFAANNSGILQRAGFATHPVWITQYKPNEMYSGGDYPNQSPTDAGLTQWVADNESLDGKDLVLWYTMGISHVPRPEDWPVMPVETAGFELMPIGFFTQNPTLNVPAPLLPEMSEA